MVPPINKHRCTEDIELFVLIIFGTKKLGIALEIVKNELKYFTRFFIKNFMVWNIIV
jgi:hypothetical protein